MTTVSGFYNVLPTDRTVNFDTTATSGVAVLPSPPTNGLRFVIKDSTGNAAANPVVIVTGGGELIDGVALPIFITVAFGALTLYSDGVNYFRE